MDLAAGYYPDIRTGHFFYRRVGMHSFACIARTNHPVVKGALSFEQFSELGHVVSSKPKAKSGGTRTIPEGQAHTAARVRRIPHFMSVPVIVSSTNAIATVPQALADFISMNPNLQQVTLPFKPPTFQVNLYWHRSAHHDAANQWLRGMLIDQFPVLQERAYDRNGRVRR